jgi:hypothetical protein
MANLSAMVGRVQALVGRHTLATDDLVKSFINSRHADLLESHEWSRKKQEIAITAVPDKTAGTVEVTNGSSTVIGTGTQFTASDVGKYIKFGADQYSLFVVRGVNFATSLTLGDLAGDTLVFPGASTTGTNYVLFKRLYSLGSGIGSIFSAKYQNPLTETSQEYLDSIDPGRSATATAPLYYARDAWDQSTAEDLVRIEFYPRPVIASIITVEVLKAHVDLLTGQNPIVPSPPLEWFSAVDTCYALFARTKEPKWLTLAQSYNDEGNKSLEYEKNEDNKKFGKISKVRDVYGGTPAGATDFGLDHDVGFLR